MALFVVSDLHLGGDPLARMFRDDDQGMRFADLCFHVAKTPDSELLLLGDAFDLTAAFPPAKGLGSFGRALEVPIEDKELPTLRKVLERIRETNHVALDALEALAAESKVTLVPGN